MGDSYVYQNQVLSRIHDRPGYIHVSLSYSRSSDVTGINARLPSGAEVKRTKGFLDRGGNRFEWDGRTRLPAIDFAMSVRHANHGGGGRALADTGDWALVEAPTVPTGYTSRSFGGGQPTFERRVQLDDNGVVSSDGYLAYLGAYDRYTGSAAGQRLELVVPVEAEMQSDPREVVGALERMASGLDVHGVTDRVVGVAAPTRPVSWGPAGQQRGASGFWVRDSEPLAQPNSSWLHEYVHTRQAFEVTPETMWLTEATAVFFATYHAHEQGYISDSDYQRALNTTRCADDVLADPRSGWSSMHTPYQKGSRVAAWLDREIRDATDGHQDFHAVVRDLNLRDGPFTHDDVVERIAAATGQSRSDGGFRSLRRSFDDFVRSSSVPGPVGPPGREPLSEDELDEGGGEFAGSDMQTLLEELERVLEGGTVGGGGSLDSEASDLFDGIDSVSIDTGTRRNPALESEGGEPPSISVGTLRVVRDGDGVDVVDSPLSCHECGQRLPPGVDRCPACDDPAL